MRVATNAFAQNFVGQLGQLTSRQNALQAQAATGQRVRLPGDDPVAMRRVLQTQTQLQSLGQYGNNVARLQDTAKIAYGSLRGLHQISVRAGELATLADGMRSKEELASYAAELNQLIEHGVHFMNQKSGGNYLFGGTISDKAPFVMNRDAQGRLTSVTYQGNAEINEVEISAGNTLSVMTPGVNTTGTGIQGMIADSRNGADFFAHLLAMRDHLLAGDATAVANVDAPALRKDEENILFHIANNGVIQSRLEMAASALDQQVTDGQSDVTELTSADLAETIVQLSQAQTAYRAALQSGAQIMQQSLMDYLR